MALFQLRGCTTLVQKTDPSIFLTEHKLTCYMAQFFTPGWQSWFQSDLLLVLHKIFQIGVLRLFEICFFYDTNHFHLQNILTFFGSSLTKEHDHLTILSNCSPDFVALSTDFLHFDSICERKTSGKCQITLSTCKGHIANIRLHCSKKVTTINHHNLAYGILWNKRIFCKMVNCKTVFCKRVNCETVNCK